MSDVVIAINNLSKRYILRHSAAGDGLRHALNNALRAPVKWMKGRGDALRRRKLNDEEFWALRDVSFDVRAGDVVGIIGRNGAGKSTLLKVLSRIVEPTGGRIAIRGRVASLLEVGTGFHPELTGRENIYVNGAVLGMSRRQIAHRFDEIVAFAEIDRFLDTPVKRYSSGMYVRLAFSVAAHLDPEILIVDEVLAVGDVSFQRKCLGKMRSVAQTEGRTVLFVSHDLSAISSLTSRCVLLDQGRIESIGSTREVVSHYFSVSGEGGTYERAHPSNAECSVESIRVLTSEEAGVQSARREMTVELNLTHPAGVTGLCVSIVIVNQFGTPATHSWLYAPDHPFGANPGGTRLRCRIPTVRLNVGSYTLTVYVSEPPGGRFFEVLEGVCRFDVVRLDEATLWGWRPEACVYHEDVEWSAEQRPGPLQGLSS